MSNGGKRAMKRTIQDHPHWRQYLDSRHVLESAIAAGAWVEYEQSTEQEVLVWREKRRAGDPGATRRRLLPATNGATRIKVKWQIPGQKSDEVFYFAGALDELKRAIKAVDGIIYIVEGEMDVWSLHTLGIHNVIGTYSATSIPSDIASILDMLGAIRFIYLADNDQSGDAGAAKLATLLAQSGWQGEGEFRKVKGPGIPPKGDANDLLCHHYPDLAAALAALDALPTFLPQIERDPAPALSIASGYNDPRWDPVKEAVRIALDVSDYNRKGFSKKHFRCLDPQHEDPGPSANWHREGFCHCFGCGKDFNAKQMAEWLGIPWRDLLGAQRQIRPANNIDLNAVPRQLEPVSAPLIFEQPPDSFLRLSNKAYTAMYSSLYYFAARLRHANLLPAAFTTDEFFKAAPSLGCELSERTIYDNFAEARHSDDHPFFAKFDPSEKASSRNLKFRLRSAADIRQRLLRCLRFRVYEEEFRRAPDTIIGYEVFAAGPLGSESAKALEETLKPLYDAQNQRYKRLVRKCEDILAGYAADLDDRQVTPLPADWKIRKKGDLPAGMAHAIFAADGIDRSRSQWQKLLGISTGSVSTALDHANIKRTARIKRVQVKSKDDLLGQARKENARIMGVETNGVNERFDAAMEIIDGSTAFLQPPAEHELIAAEQPQIRPTPAKARVATEPQNSSERANNMEKPGKWHKASWDPQFRYWELVKVCHIKHGYQVKAGVGIYNPETGEIWRNPSLNDLVGLIIGLEPIESADST